MFALGYFLGFVMGMTLGLLGAGGSILTVPILVYCFQIAPLTATGYSLLIVGAIALAGAFTYFRQHLVDIRAGVTFSLPAMLAVWLTRTYLIPALPDPLIESGGFAVSKDNMILILFGLLMLASAFFMIRRSRDAPTVEETQPPEGWLRFIVLVLSSAGVGVLTGLVGAGGGFIIVPTLTVLFKLPVKMAVGTSLMVIAMNGLTGFNSDLMSGLTIDAVMLISFMAATLSGMFVGTVLNKLVDPATLCKLFALVTVVLGLFILLEQADLILALRQ
jgi:uncharacterized membrane protein YfcA